MDPASTVALIVALLSALAHFVDKSHLKKLDCCCLHSDCREGQDEKKMLELQEKIDRNSEKLAKLKSKSSPVTPISGQSSCPSFERETQI